MMYTIMNSNGPDLVPGYKVTPYVSLFFCMFMIFGAFFIINLFVGVIITAYNREMERVGNSFILTEEQQELK